MAVRYSIIVLALSILTGAPAARGAMWGAQPIVVHEWGVEEFDWSGTMAAVTASEIPSYMYTDAHPGLAVPISGKKTKDLPPDWGLRKKPVLYFYPGDLRSSWSNPIPIGVEVRFAQGHATAWYPQVNVYRPEAVAAAGQAVDLQSWGRAARTPGRNRPPMPDDTRMQLAWYSLTLSNKDPIAAPLPGADLAAGHWAKTAREIPGAAYVSNGKEAEKYLFYEGATHERPAIAIVPRYDFRISQGPRGQIVNVSDRTIFNVFAIYHSAGHTWVGYQSALEPMKSAADFGSGGVTIPTLSMPDFTAPKVLWTDLASLREATTARLLSALTEGGAMTVQAREYRDPAEPQGPTTSSQLFPEEAAALEKIWHHDFFDAGAADGLTIIYRQSPAQLDADMPLKLYTDMYHYFTLSRCGLVVVRNIDLRLAIEANQKVLEAGATGWQSNDKVRGDALAFLHQHPGMALSALAFVQKQNNSPQCQALREQLEAGH